RELPLPDNVRLFSHRAPQTVTLDELGVAIHGQSFARADITDDLAAGYPPPAADAFNIGLLPTCATGFAGHDRYAPTSVETLQPRRSQYWALGPVPTARTLSEKPPVVFPGNLQGRRVTEAGPKGCQVVTVHDDEIVERRFEPVDVVRWLALEVDVAGVAALDEAVNRVEEQLRHLVGDHPGRVLAVRVELRGECDAHQVLSARRGELLDKIHAIAADTGQGEIWIERLDLDTAKAGASQGHEGPFREVEIYADELAEAPGSLLDLAPELRDLLNILPAGLRDGESAPGLLDTESLQRALTEAQVLLSEKLIAREPAQ
ncbi:MAG: DNA repair exonuclease, partial [bacterium]|nr:DNA repair exonuclease [bacterium]